MSDTYETRETSDLLRLWCEMVGYTIREYRTGGWYGRRGDEDWSVNASTLSAWHGFGLIVDEMRRRGHDWCAAGVSPSDGTLVQMWAQRHVGPLSAQDPDPARAACIAALRALDAAREVRE